MQKQTPTVGKLVIMAAFALSCFGILLYMWLAFGGPIPLKPQGYRMEVAFPKAVQLAKEAEVRVAGVEIGRVAELERDAQDGNRTVALIEIERRYAPIAQDAKAMLRYRTLLGETYVEFTTGTHGGPTVPEGGRLENAQVESTVELDEILSAFDDTTRAAWRTWQQSLAEGIKDQGPELNVAFGNLPGFVERGGDVMEVLDEQRSALGRLVRDTGVVFAALTEREDQLSNVILNSEQVFETISNEREAFAETWQVFPTFLDESRLTLDRLREFSIDTQPLMEDMVPALEEVGPTLRATRDFAPDLRQFFRDFDPLITSSQRSLPATREIFRELRPMLGSLATFLSEFNPWLDWIAYHQHTLTDMFANLGGSTAARTEEARGQGLGHYLRQFGAQGVETASMHPQRLRSNRGNTYHHPLNLVSRAGALSHIIPNWDCNNAGGEKSYDTEPGGTPACRVQGPIDWQQRTERFPKVNRHDYSRPGSGAGNGREGTRRTAPGRRPPAFTGRNGRRR
jgi:phospholipid/cholesterol/gamma-HCH transport system substrate-binding protein